MRISEVVAGKASQDRLQCLVKRVDPGTFIEKGRDDRQMFVSRHG